ncbi:hypothetical protein [Teichococcus aestuarii]
MAIAALNLMYLRDAIDQGSVVQKLLPALQQAARELAEALSGLKRPG